MQDLLQELLRLAERNNNKNIFIRKTSALKYFEYLPWEIEEAKRELRKNNNIYLEDELWDILWVYLNLLNKLEDENFIENKQKVLKRAIKKFWERTKNISQNNLEERKKYWDNIKKKQKQELLEEHNKKYNK